jgi:hypothetical protein
MAEQSLQSNPPFHILRASTREELEKLIAEAEATGWKRAGKVERRRVGDDERYYCQVIGEKQVAR